MNTIAKIRAEIERRKKENMYVDLPMSIGRYYEDRDLLAFLDTLEEPVSDDLEEAEENPYVLNDVSHAAFEYERTRNDLDARSDNEVVRRAFKAGAEWMKRKMMEGATYNELMELYRAIRDELVKRHCDVPVNIKEEQ